MPTYPYACTECGHQFEQFQSFHDDPLTTCPECSGRLRKVWGSVGVVFKGSGFYRTDSRSGSDSKGTGSTPSKGSGASSDSGSSSGGDTKGSSGTGSSTTPSSTTSGSASSSSGAA